MEERHTGENIQINLDDLTQKLNLPTEVPWYVVHDNAANMKLGVNMSDSLIQYLCNNHTLQLAIQDTFKETDGMKAVLGLCKALATLTHKSEPLKNG